MLQAYSLLRVIYLFSHQLCRVLNYKSKNETIKHHSLDGILYQLPETTFANATVHPDNWCFENNLPSGLQNGSHCNGKNSPIYFSFPHFYGADKFYLDQFDKKSDLKPAMEQHASTMLIEPVKPCPSLNLLHGRESDSLQDILQDI